MDISFFAQDVDNEDSDLSSVDDEGGDIEGGTQDISEQPVTGSA